MASNITNDAAYYAAQLKSVAQEIAALETKAAGLMGQIVARGITWDGTTTGVALDADVSGGVTAVNNLVNTYWPTYKTNIVKCSQYGG